MAVRLGFLGGGFIARYHAMMLQLGRADAELTAVFDPDPHKGRGFAAEYGCTLVDHEDALLDAVDAVYICTWTVEHRRLVTEAAARGLPLFCEKPLATNLADALAMVDAVERAGVVNQVGLVMRDYPGFLLMKRLITREGAGRPMAVVFRDDQYIPTQGMYESSWRGDKSKAGAGTLLEHSIHDLDILEWLLGPVETVSGHSAGFHQLDGIEDAVVASLRFENGALATLTSVWHDVLERPSMRHVEVFTERSYSVLDGELFGPLRWTGPDGDAGDLRDDDLVERLHAEGVPTRNPDAAFVEAVQRGEPASPDLRSALRAHLLVEAVYRSCAEGGRPLDVAAFARAAGVPDAIGATR